MFMRPMCPAAGGDDVSGWGVHTVRLTPFSYPLCQATMGGALGPSAASDPYAVMPEFMWEHKVRQVGVISCLVVV
jgi:hypothetical protein